MHCKFHRQFLKDLGKLEAGERVRLAEFLDIVQNKKWSDLNPVKIKGYKDSYRFRVGNYRIGVTYDQEVLVLRRCLHRKNIYKKFP
jgi:mRNA interferase RelE/StbE